MYEIRLERQAEKDLKKILSSPLKKQLFALMELIEQDPYQPPYEKLSGDLSGLYSRRINIRHRLVYRIDEEKKCVVILRMWTHYGDN
ncbi:MAG: Txe/YoeB family addiction module toxin [Clostridiales bacterium]|nr:Txe/YoeB family addiction module toxin [Clostridiales bacterium]